MNAATKQPPLVVDLEAKPRQELVSAEPGKAPALASPGDPMELFAQLARDGVDVDRIEKLLQMYERQIARKAQEAFNASMTDAQDEMRPISADAHNPQTKSRYASYAQLDRALRPIYTKHGFAISYDTAESPMADHVRVLAYVTHRAGHDRTYKVDMPNDGKGAKGGDVMTKTHATGAAMSYGMRYLLKMIFNVAVGEEDRDGNEVRERRGAAPATKPKGYDDWFMDMQSGAEDGGWPLVSDAWKKSRKDFRDYATKHDADRWKALRDKAAKVQA